MSAPDNKPRMAFISHASEDAEMAQRVCRLLEKREVSCWIAPRDVGLGTRYGEGIVNAIENARALVLVLSEHANKSDAVCNEVERAFSNKKLIVPFRLDEIPPSPALEFFVGQAQWVNAWDGPINQKIDQLARAIKSVKPSRDPAGAPMPPPHKAPKKSRRTNTLWIAACIGLVLAASIFYSTSRQSRLSVPTGSFRTVVEDADDSNSQRLSVPRYHALVIGIDGYKPHSGEGWSPLSTAREGAEALTKLLEDEYGFLVKTLYDDEADRGSIMSALDGLATLGPSDACLVYFAGHGYYDKSLSEGYWIPANARRTINGRDAREDWIWNSTITKIISASTALHVLVIADSCYAGSLFRGEASGSQQGTMKWYGRAIGTPSRYLIASGNLEPVLDSGGRYSIFTDQLLSFLKRGDKNVFSAGDVGMFLRQKVSAMTGQMVQMGPLAVSGHAGGEFVFVKKDASLSEGSAEFAKGLSEGQTRDASRSPSERTASEIQKLLQDVLALSGHGATNAADHLIHSLLGGNGDDRMAQAVATHLDSKRRAEQHNTLRELIGQIENRKADPAAAQKYMDSARPRILACLGPNIPKGGADNDNLALLYQIALRAEIEQTGKVQVVEREALEDILEEMNIGTSVLADKRAATEVGRLLPASLLLLGDLLITDQGEMLYMRLVDTETSRIVASSGERRGPDDDMGAVCAEVASKLVAAAVKAKPLAARVTERKGDRLQASIGTFHGANENMTFQIVERIGTGDSVAPGGNERLVGRATTANMGQDISEFSAVWSTNEAPQPQAILWIREVADE